MIESRASCAILFRVQRAGERTINDEVLTIWNARYKAWGCPGGKAEPGEAPQDTMIRELREEVGVEAVAWRRVMQAPGSVDAVTTVTLFEVTRWLGEPRTVEEGHEVVWRPFWEICEEDNPFGAYYRRLVMGSKLAPRAALASAYFG